MRICYIGDAKSIHTRRWAEYFAKKGHDVHLVSKNEGKIEGVNFHLLKLARDTDHTYKPIRHKSSKLKLIIKRLIGVNSILFGVVIKIIDSYNTVSLDLKYARQCREIVRRICPDILHGHFLTQSGFYAAYTGYKPLVLSAWGSDVLVFPKQSVIKRIYCKYSIKRADVITAESETMENELLGMGAFKDKIARFSWGIDCNICMPGYSLEVKKLKNELRIYEKAPVVLSNRGLHPGYNIGCILRAVPVVRMLFPDVVFIFLGGASLPEYKNMLKKDISKADVSDNVRFLPDFIDTERMAIFLNAADILISIPDSESFSISVLEAMGCGAIPIMSNIEANIEIIEQGGDGLLLPDINEERLSSTIVYCINNLTELKKKMQIKNRRFILKDHNWEMSTKKMEDVYQTLINTFIRLERVKETERFSRPDLLH